MRKRTVIRIFSFSLAALLASVGFLALTLRENRRFEIEIENTYSKSLEELGVGFNNISLALKKAQFVSSPKQISEIAARLLTEAQLSKNALSQLPGNGEIPTVNKFLSQVGNFAMAVSGSLLSGEEISKDSQKSLTLLSDTADKMTAIINDAQISFNNSEYWARELEKEIDTAVDDETLSEALKGIEEELTDYPTLIYDGPYSDHILEKEPEMLKEAKEVTERGAMEIAAKIAETEIDTLKSNGRIFGNIPCYRFKGDNLTVSISIKGGYPLYMRKERDAENSILSYEQAVEKAKRYLERIGLSGFRETYYFTSDGVCVVNFAFIDGETICYTDLVKVGVAMDNGEIMLFEGSGYISNHKNRTFTTPAHTTEKAREKLNEKLNVTGTALALIPTDSAGEVRCYEFTCTSDGNEEILVYLNTSTLEEEDILILLKSDGGTLVK